MTTRVCTPPRGLGDPIQANGNTYHSTAPGSIQDVPDFDAQVLASHGWAILGEVCTSDHRPVGLNATAGMVFIDTTINAVIYFDGESWHNLLTGDLV